MKQTSILDIINPIMVGPSSSHTAGAVRIGQIVRNIYARQIKEVQITLYNSYASTGRGHGTDKGILAGLLGFEVDNVIIKNIFESIEASKIQYHFEFKESFTKHPNSVDFVFMDDDDFMKISARSIGGGEVEVYEINGFSVSLNGKYNSILIVMDDMKGNLSKITNVVNKYGINIASLNCERKSRGALASVLIALDSDINQKAIDEIDNAIKPYIIRYVEKL